MTRPNRPVDARNRRAAAAAALSLLAVLAGVPARAATSTDALRAGALGDLAGRCDLRSTAQVEQWFRRGLVMPISSYDDDPFAADSVVECLPTGGFPRTADGRLLLANDRVTVANEDKIYRFDRTTGIWSPFLWNPWPVVTTSAADGSFRFPDEPRFPLVVVQRDAAGKPILVDGLQVWESLDLHRGMTTAFDAANSVKDAIEAWAGRPISWGENGNLLIEPHAFYDLNAFFSPSGQAIFSGIIVYRLPGTTELKTFETATSWEMMAHESGHAAHAPLKPNHDFADEGYGVWTESFADQTNMWAQLRDRGRVRALLAAGSLAESNPLSRIVEAWAAFIPGTTAERDAVNDTTLSDAGDEIHDRSAVLTGAMYRIFVSIFDDQRRGLGDERALEIAGDAMGVFLAHTTDHTPENRMTLEDVGKAYLKVDAELFGGRYHDRLVDELEWRGILDADSVGEWAAHEASLPQLRLAYGSGWTRAADLVRRNLDRLGVDPAFGLVVQSVTPDVRFHRTLVRVQLTLGRGAGAVRLDDHGVLVFRADGTLADYQAPAPVDASAQADVASLIDRARRLRLDSHGAPLSIVRDASGALAVEARVLRGDGPNVWVDAYTIDAPHGERREIPSTTEDRDAQARRLRGAGVELIDADELAR